RADILRLLDKHKGSLGLSRTRFGALSRCLDWHAERDTSFLNPCKLIGRKFRPKRPPPRQRVYTAAEIKALWDAAGALDNTRRDFLRLMILAPLRRMECSELTAASMDLGRGALVLSSKQTKNGDAFILPLPQAALEIIEHRAATIPARSRARLFQLNERGTAM